MPTLATIMRRLPASTTLTPLAAAWMVAACLPLVAGAWWPIAASRGVLDAHATTFRTDWISFAPLPEPWVLQPWLSSLLLRGAYEVGGIVALSLLSALTWMLVVQLVRRTAIAAGAGPLPAMLATLAVLPLLWPLLLENQALAVLLATLLTWLLWRRDWWWAPLVVAAWANVHGSAPAGVLLCAAAAAGAVAGAPPASLRPIARRAAWVAACAAAMLASPLGIEIVDYVRDVGSVEDLAELTPAWAGAGLVSPTSAWIAAVVAVVLAGLARGATSRPLGERVLQALLMLALALAALAAQRHSVWLAVVAAPHLALALDRWWRRRGWNRAPRSTFVEPVVLVAIVAGVVATFPGMPLQRSLSTTGLPHDRLLAQVGRDDAVYAPIHVADHLHVRTRARVFVDARLERYDPDTLRDYVRLADGDLAQLEPVAGASRTLLLVAPGWSDAREAAADAGCLRAVAARDGFELHELVDGRACS